MEVLHFHAKLSTVYNGLCGVLVFHAHHEIHADERNRADDASYQNDCRQGRVVLHHQESEERSDQQATRPEHQVSKRVLLVEGFRCPGDEEPDGKYGYCANSQDDSEEKQQICIKHVLHLSLNTLQAIARLPAYRMQKMPCLKVRQLLHQNSQQSDVYIIALKLI